MKKILSVLLLIFSVNTLLSQQKMKEKIEYDNEYDKKYYTKYLSTEKGMLVESISNIFLIKQDPKDFYKGRYKENKPYEGYFIGEKILNEMPIIRYYEKGILKKQYSYDLLEKDQFEPPFEYDKETIYENKKVKSGHVYFAEKKQNSETMIGVVFYDHFEITQFYIDIFAENYFNRIIFKNEQGKLIINQLGNDNHLEIEKKDTLWSANLYKSDEKVATSKQMYDKTEPGTPNSITEYYLKNDSLKIFYFKKNDFEQSDESLFEDTQMFHFFSKFPTEYNKTASQLLLDIINAYQLNKEELLSFINPYPFAYNEQQVICRLFYDNTGKIKEGESIAQKDDKTYQLDFYFDGKIIATKIVHHLNSIKKEADHFYSKP